MLLGSGILLSVPLLVVDATRMRVLVVTRMRVLVATRMRVLYLTLMRVFDVTLMKVLHITFEICFLHEENSPQYFQNNSYSSTSV